MYAKGADGLYEVKTPFGSAWFSEEAFQAGYATLKAAGIDPETNPIALLQACSKQVRLIPGADIIAGLLAAGIGTKDTK